MSNLKVIEVRDGHLPEGISGKDLSGPIVLMTNGKLPEGVSEQHLSDIGATVLSVRSGDKLPVFIAESESGHLQSVAEEKLKKLGIIVVDDAVIAAGKAEIERQFAMRADKPSAVQIEEYLAWVERLIEIQEKRLMELKEFGDELRQLLASKKE